MRQITHLLCAIDFSDESRHALDHALVLAKWYEAKVSAVFVYSPPSPLPDASGFAFPGVVLDEAYRKALETQLQSWLHAADTRGLPSIDSQVVQGTPADGILETAKQVGADLIVIGTHGFSGFQHLILGSVAERVLRRALCPVLTVPPRARKTSKLPLQRVLCPVDFGDASMAALELAASIASEGDADLTVLHVLEPGADADPLTSRPITVPEYHQLRHDQACTQLKSMIDSDMREWCRPSTRIVRGKPYREILGVAAEDEADLIVMGIHGRNPVDVALFGSTTNHVVRSATCPVMTVKQGS